MGRWGALLALCLFLPSPHLPIIPSVSAAEQSAVQCVVVALKGKVSLLRAGKKVAVPAKKGDFVYEGDTLTTGPDSLADVALTGGAEVRINAKSTFKLDGAAANGTQKGEMNEGQIWSRLLHGHAEFHVTTPNAVAAVRGTEADIDVHGDLTVKVYDGVVDVINSYGRSTLTQGQSTTVHGTSAPPAPPHAMGPGEVGTWQHGISADDKTKQDLLNKLQQEAGSAPEKTLKMTVDENGKQKTIRIKFKKGQQQ